MIREVQARTLCDRQRDYTYAKLDRRFPGLRPRYEKNFGKQYSVPAQDAAGLGGLCTNLCREYGLAPQVPVFTPRKREQNESVQPRLF